MWNYVKFGLGLLLMLSTVIGAISVMKGDAHEAGRRIVEGGVDTTGVVEKVEQVTVAARWGKVGGMGRYYTMTYGFTTKDGVSYSDEINISKEQAHAVQIGDEIGVRYYANQPTINSALGFEEYMTAEEAENVPFGTFAFSMLLFFFGGAWLTWSSWRRIRPASAAPVDARMSPVPTPSTTPVVRSAGGPMFGRR